MTNQEKRGAVIGMILGDGHIRPKRYTISISHSEKQKEYLFFKKEILETIQKSKISLCGRTTYLNGKKYFSVRLETRKIPMYRVLHKRFHPNGLKEVKRDLLNQLTPLGIAIWFMDDGSTTFKKKEGKIHGVETVLHTYLSKEQNEIIVKYFQEVWNIKWGLNKSKGKYRLRMGTKEAKKFVKIIEPHIISSMKYKIDKLLT